MKTIMLMRHGKSDRENSETDFDRPLSKRGLKDVPRMAQTVAKCGIVPELIISSPAARAKKTAELFVGELVAGTELRFEKSLYGESSDAYLKCIKNTDNEVNCLMLTGHNPDIERTAEFLACKENGGLTIKMPTAGIICLQAEITTWDKTEGGIFTILWHIVPKIID